MSVTSNRKLNKSRDKRTMELLNKRIPIIELCGPCKNTERKLSASEIINDVCKIYLNPESRWRVGECPKCSVDHKEIVERCEGCENTRKITTPEIKIEICDLFIYPDQKWLTRICPQVSFKTNRYGKVNPLKASRRTQK